MYLNKIVVITLVLFMLSLHVGTGYVSSQENNLVIKEMGVFYVGGTITESNSSGMGGRGNTASNNRNHIVTNQAKVNYFIPPEEKSPIVMVPGMGLSSNIYLTTPDGRNGWVFDFASAGYPVYTYDNSDLSVSGLNINQFDSGNSASLFKWTNEIIWQRFGIGKKPGEPYENTKFPVESINQTYSSFPAMIQNRGGGARGSGNIRGGNNSRSSGKVNFQQESKANSSRKATSQSADNLIKILEKTDPAILIVHSMGGTTGFEVIRSRPELVKGIIAIEPVGSPTDKNIIKKYYKNIPYLAVYGDYIQSRNQTGRMEACKTTAELIRENGGKGKVIELTKEGIDGNTHLMMWDKNSAQIAEKIVNWLGENL